jgi:hypothetical protein
MPTRRMSRRPRRRTNRRRSVKPYRMPVARIPRPLNVKAQSSIQNCTYYNSFFCSPELGATSQHQNFAIKLNLNSPWLFSDGWNILASGTNQVLTPNGTVTPVPNNGTPIIDPDNSPTTCMPGIIDGPQTIKRYAQGCVVGTRVTLVATPVENEATARVQAGLFYAIKHTQSSSGIQATSDINTINALPFRKAKQISAYNSSSVGKGGTFAASRIVVNHSPKSFNNVQSLRDNQQFFFKGGSSPSPPSEGDYLTVGITPMLISMSQGGSQSPTVKATNFRLDMKVEQTILWTEPLEETGTLQGNYSYPYSAYMKRAAPSGYVGYMLGSGIAFGNNVARGFRRRH